ncbi:MAG TPA: PAS domain S-box protein [Pirellulaceae bacterium]|nr:PAS domain S-box protein [Pirellulaceae bacterium]
MSYFRTLFNMATAPKRHRVTPLRVAGIYLAFGVLWILLSDSVIQWLPLSGNQPQWVHSTKGIAFVSLSAALLYLVTLREIRAVVRATDLLRAVCDEASDAIYVKDREGRYLMFNPAAARFAGCSPEEAIGKTDNALFDAKSAQAAIESDKEVLTARRAVTAEQHLTARGVSRTFLSTKAPYFDEEGQIIGIIGIALDITDRKQAEHELREREALSRAIIETSADGFWMLDMQGRLLDVNEAYARRVGYSRQELLRMSLADIEAQLSPAEILEQLAQIRQQGHLRYESMHRAADGTTWPVETVTTYWPISGGRIFGFTRDISERQRTEQTRQTLERQLHQSQKMEAIGLLAGGVAHDFNNLLTIICGYSEMLLGDLPASDPKRGPLQAISEAGDQAADLTRQLLAFSRKSVLEPKVIDLNAVVHDTEKMLRRLIGEDVLLTTQLTAAQALVKVDPGQMRQLLINLAVNARDAMPQGGKLIVSTELVRRDDAQADSSDKTGMYIELSIADTGCGMTSEVQARIFEPFFSTKEARKGTGIGLATVYSIVQQSGGRIEVDSRVGEGTTFRIYLPVVEQARQLPASDSATLATAARGNELILLVEDEESVRQLSAKALQSQGYEVVTSHNGLQALKLAAGLGKPIDLLVTDVVMPAMSGRQLAEALVAQQPGLKVLYLSGYTADAVVRHGVLQAEVAFLQKPFTPQSLAMKVRQVLDQAR